MPETTRMTRAWRPDPGEWRDPATDAGTASRARPRCEGDPADPEARPLPSVEAIGPRRLGAAVVRVGLAAWARSFGRNGSRFEEILHDFAARLEIPGNAEAVEAALIRLAHQIAPSSRVELIRAAGDLAGSEDADDPHVRADEYARPGPVGASDGSFQEFPLRCGAANHGVLRLYTPAWRYPQATRLQMQRRIATACTLAACALENARWQAVWSREGEAGSDEGRISDPATGSDAGRSASCQRPDVVRDATFLNAVLPFALGQSRRHGEPVSLLCIQLDRLGAIRDLLGSSLADRLVHELGETVAGLVRSSDIVARLDDDRIVALLVRARADGAMKVARTVGRAVAESGLGSPRFPGVSVSIGVAEFPATASDATSLLESADEAMSLARAGGSRAPVLAGTRSGMSVVRCPSSVVC